MWLGQRFSKRESLECFFMYIYVLNIGRGNGRKVCFLTTFGRRKKVEKRLANGKLQFILEQS